MKPEYANHSTTRAGIVPPTPAEFIEAARRGLPLSGSLLKEIRSSAKSAKRSIANTEPANTQPGSITDATTIRTLKTRVTALENENTQLKLKAILGK